MQNKSAHMSAGETDIFVDLLCAAEIADKACSRLDTNIIIQQYVTVHAKSSYLTHKK